MPITYDRLWETLKKKGLKKKDLREHIHPAVIAKLTRNETISTSTLNKLCEILECSLDEICEYVPDKKEGGEQ